MSDDDDIVHTAIRRAVAARSQERTHWEGCYTDPAHRDCAIKILLDEVDELERSFGMQWDAGQRAIKRWQEAHPGNDHVWPDRADLIVWLMDELEKKT